MALSVKGPINKTFERDIEGHRTYTITYLVISTDHLDGPQSVLELQNVTLPDVGDSYSLGNDSDTWARCHPDWTIQPVVSKDQNFWWHVTIKFSTKPLTRCQTASIDDPLDEPDRISGSFVKYTLESLYDYLGQPMRSSSFERLRGAAVEKDQNRPTVVIEKNVATLPLSTFAPMIDTVNDATLWGLAARSVKLSNVSWERKLYGTCSYYYTVRYEFDIDYGTFDRLALDEGTMVLGSGGDRLNPKHFVRYKDLKDENPEYVILDGSGNAWNGAGAPGQISVQLYAESNFLLLGIPTSL